MRAVVLDRPGGPEALRLTTRSVPNPASGWVLVKVFAFGLNRSEQHFRNGLATSGSLPRVPGIEAVGVVAAAPGGEFTPGTQVATMMGGMGRDFDGGYAEYTCVPARQVIPFTSALPWSLLGAVPEMLQTAAGSLDTGVEGREGQTLLIRGGTSSVGMALAVLARMRGIRVISTTRRTEQVARLREIGVDEVVIDDGTVADAVRRLVPGGADAAVELVGTNVLKDTLHAVRRGGTVCFTGMLSDQWTIPDFYPMDWLPNGVRLTAYSGEASDLDPSTLQGFLDAVAAGQARVPVGRTYDLDEIVQAHRDLDANTIGGKGVVLTPTTAA
jgi:NADPH2:quinone reductase